MDSMGSGITVLAGQAIARLWPPPAAPDDPIDWRTVPAMEPACFAALTETERAEWGELMVEYSAPGAYHRHKDDRAFFRRLAELDNKIDWDTGLHDDMWRSQQGV
jgi:hypothetical protein